jgi:hypothetical protein
MRHAGAVPLLTFLAQARPPPRGAEPPNDGLSAGDPALSVVAKARALFVEVRQGRHAAVRRQMIDQLRQHGRKLVQHFLLAHAGALGELVQRILAERRAERSGLNRLVRALPDP